MAANEISTAPIVIKKIKKGGHAHHGGSWKVAYADFVTAMMALFLLLWILETTTMAERESISDFFQNPSMINAAGGASTAIIDLGGGMDAPKGEGGKIAARNPQQLPSEEAIVEEAREVKQFEELKLILEQTIDSNPVLKQFEDQILIDVTDDGLRVQIVDQDDRPMFASGSAKLKPYSQEVLHEIAKVIDELNNPITISGHTDASRVYKNNGRYTNWELSSERANAARYELVNGGYSQKKIVKVIGLADSAPLDRKDLMSTKNRRISIIILNKKAIEAMNERPSLELKKDKGTDFTRDLPNILEKIEQQMDSFPQKKPRSGRSGGIDRGAPSPVQPLSKEQLGQRLEQQSGPQILSDPIELDPVTKPAPIFPADKKAPEKEVIQLEDGSTLDPEALEKNLNELLGNQ